MKIKTTYTAADIDFCYDCIIFTTIAIAIITLIGRLAGVC